MSVRATVMQEFYERFGAAPAFVTRAPGRVNLIGEHTDYNDGFVLPMAIDREICIALRPRVDGRVVVHSLEFGETAEFDLNAVTHGPHGWQEYVKGAAWVLQQNAQPVQGWEGVLSGDVPRGAGLSSSAAVELATLRAFAAVSELSWDAQQAALRGRRVENEWIGVNSGIMDQMVVAAARAQHALLIDCRTLSTEDVPIPPIVSVVVLDTGTRRGLVDSAYNERRRQCEQAAASFGVSALRDLDDRALNADPQRLDPLTLRRARHVITENARTLQAAQALRSADLPQLGRLLNASHASLRDDFEVTNNALDEIVNIAQAQEACFGARMTGAGFGGCAVGIVELVHTDRFIDAVTLSYQAATGLQPHAYACHAAAGTSLLTPIESVPS